MRSEPPNWRGRDEALHSCRLPIATRVAWWLMLACAVFIAVYALTLQDGRSAQATVFGQRAVDYSHFVFGGVAMLCGPFAFRRQLLRARPRLHRTIGFIYVGSALVSGLCGFAMATVAGGGLTTALGFGGLSVLWLATTTLGFRAIRRRDVVAHRRLMVRSFALCFAAATFRFELGPLIALTGDAELAYRCVSWVCWVPNLLFAEWWLRQTTPAGEWRTAVANASGSVVNVDAG